MNGKLKRVLCLLLSLVLLWQAAPVTQVQAVEIRLPEVEIGADILANDLFYLASTSATLHEGANETYLLRVGRGGEAATESSVLVKISDVTAQYGKDYSISVLDGSSKVEVPEDNCSLMDLLIGQPFEVTELKDEEEAEAIFAEDEDGMAAAEAGVAEALNYLAERSGVEFDDDSSARDPVQQARNLYTGVDGSSQRVTATEDMFQQMQDIANVMTEVVPGASVALTFAPGETEKLMRITVTDNKESNGDRMFFVILAETEGSTTNSAASTCAITIADDEAAVPSVVSFSADTYSEIKDGMVTVTLHREGALSSVVTARVKTVSGTAEAGRDYSEVNREIVFPFGVSDMPLQIPVNTEYFTGEAGFELTVEPGVGCTVEAAEASVQLTGTGSADTETSEAASALRAGSRGQVQSLTTVRTDPAIDLEGTVIPDANYNRWNEGVYQYNTENKRWEIQWYRSFGTEFTEGAGPRNELIAFILTTATNPYWYGGARVTWETTDNHSNHHAEFRLSQWGEKESAAGLVMDYSEMENYTLYQSAQSFGKKTVDFYPSATNLSDANQLGTGNNSVCFQTLAFRNYAGCRDCNFLYIYDIEPILRPFLAKLEPADEVPFLQEDGTSAAFPNDVAVKAEMEGSVDRETSVVFMNDTVTISQPAGSNVTRYLYLKGIEYVPANKPETSRLMATHSDYSDPTVTMTMTKDNIRNMFNMEGSSFVQNDELLAQLKSGDNATFYKSQFSNQAPDYGLMTIRPTFEYIGATVTLENPYDFPVCYTISGTDYWVGAKDSVELEKFNLGDVVAVSKITLDEANGTEYTPIGVDMKYRFQKDTGDYKRCSKPFSNGKPIYITEDKDGLNRLAYEEVVLSPNLTELKTRIVVRVKTSELDKFENTTLLTLPSAVNGAYTEFDYASLGQVVTGKIYPISVTPKSEDTVCVWQTNNGNYYLGDTFYFEAGKAESQPENTVTLSTLPANSEIELTGKLNYRDYNLLTHDYGTASTMPAVGAVVIAGNMRGITGDDGSIASNKMKIPASPYRYRLRCLVMINGDYIISDIKLPFRITNNQIDISSTFDNGVSPAMSTLFNTVWLEIPEANGSGRIPLGDFSESFHVDVHAKPVIYTVERADGSGGFVKEELYEKPVSVQLKIVDSTGKLRYAFDVVDDGVIGIKSGEYTFSQEIPFELASSDGTPIYAIEPGDQLTLTLTTNLLSQVDELELPPEALELLETTEGAVNLQDLDVDEFTYSSVFTGYTIYSLNLYTPPVTQGLGDSPVEFQFTSLPLLGDVGMNLQFPFVNVGWQRTADGYRMFIGVSPMMIIDKVRQTATNRYKGDDGFDWVTAFDPMHPFKTWKQGLDDSFHAAFADAREKSVEDVASLGARQWRFNFALGMYFDFTVGTATDEYGLTESDFLLSGMGAYVSATVGFKTAWYTIIPVVFIPAYFGIKIEATVMGFFGAHRDNTDPTDLVSMHDAKNVPNIDFGSSFHNDFHYCIDACGIFQFSAGVGLCGTIGARLVGECDVIYNYDPATRQGASNWGVNLTFKAGGMIDLFLTSVPLMYTFPQLKFGKFAEVAGNQSVQSGLRSSAAEDADPFRFRAGTEESSEWLGNSTKMRGAFTPKQTYTLVENSYERADAQLITLRNGAVVLVYLSNDPDKGPYQRTTLMMTTCEDGNWSEPVVVSDDGTADFQPSIAETNDGRVLVAWVSTEADDITEDTPTVDYLRSMEVFAAFAEIGETGAITVGETTRISHDRRAEEGQDAHYYDANPTVVCDTKSGDAIIYYIKSGSVAEDPAELANPYTNDSVVCYLPYDNAKGKWMTDEFYDDEIAGETPEEVAANEQYLIDNFCGQRFVDSPAFEGENGWEYYSIPDFTAISYDGKVLYAYTIDRDSSNDTDTDKELILQVYSFENHNTYFHIRMTDDVVPDALPQFYRAEHAAGDGTRTQVKLFWYRAGLGVCYLDISDLLESGINPDGTVKPKADGSDTRTTPHYINSMREDTNEARQLADFHVAEDANGSLYVIWTAPVQGGENEIAAQEVFAVSQYVDPTRDEENGGGWSKPYQLTHAGKQNDEIALTLDGSNLLLVHNQYEIALTEDENDPLAISDMRLVATTLEPCGSVKTQGVTLLKKAENAAFEEELTLPQSGETVTVQMEIANDGLTTADGYHVDVFAVTADGEQKVWSCDAETRLPPNTMEILSFDWTIPQTVSGTYLRIETQENHYSDHETFTTEPLEASADYALTDVATRHAEDGFHLTGTLTNNGNAATAHGEMLTVLLTGPYDLPELYPYSERTLLEAPIEELGVGESSVFDVVVDVPAEMLEEFRYVAASVEVKKENTSLSNAEHVEFRVTRPVNFTVNSGEPIRLAVTQTEELTATMALGEQLGGDEVVFTVEDINIARIEGDKLLGVTAGETTLVATHAATGASVSVPVTVTGSQPVDPPEDNPFTDVEEGKFYYDPVLWAYYHDPQITIGTSKTTFSPNDGATRAQVVTFLWRAAGCPETTTITSPFTDVPDGRYYTKAALWAAEKGITCGTSATTFTPNRICTRAEVVTFLYRFAGSPEVGDVENPFTDVPEGKFYTKPVLWAVEQKVTAGTSKTTFSPKKDCTRGEVVTLLYRYMGEE